MKRKLKNFSVYALSAFVFVSALFLNVEKNEGGDYVFGLTSASAQSGGGESNPGDGAGSGFGWDDRSMQCPENQWAWVITSANGNAGASGSVKVEKGDVIPGTSIIAGVTGYYNTSTANQYANLRETYKQYCIEAAWHYYCSGPISCHVAFP